MHTQNHITGNDLVQIELKVHIPHFQIFFYTIWLHGLQCFDNVG